jgi:predicted AAA+ superfamily ATPase
VRLLRALARTVATSATVTKLAADTYETDDPLARETVYDYVSALERLLIVEDQPAWSSHLRSRAQARTTAKRHLVDPSLAVAALSASPARLLDDLDFLGFLFESLVVRDLRVYGQPSDARVLQYRDNKGIEVDAIVEARDGRWAAFEIEPGGAAAIEEAARDLVAFARRVDLGKVAAPACLGVIVAGGYGYEREDGVAIVPVGALGP